MNEIRKQEWQEKVANMSKVSYKALRYGYNPVIVATAIMWYNANYMRDLPHYSIKRLLGADKVAFVFFMDTLIKAFHANDKDANLIAFN